MRKKVIILYSTGGMGHKKAAMALLDAFKKRNDAVEAEMLDVIEYATRLYKFLYLDFYVFLMVRAKWLWGFLYYFSNLRLVDALTRGTISSLDFSSLKGLDKAIIEKNPDAIIATHFLLPSIAGLLKEKENIRSKMFTVITDYGPHSYWLSDYIDGFFVGSESVLLELNERKISTEKIYVTGIPTIEEFRRDFDVDNLRKVHGLAKDKKTIFLMSGGFGTSPVEKMLISLNSCSVDIQVIVVSGRNKDAYNRVQALKGKLNYPVILFGFTDKVAELMAVSDLMITKAGGISVTEALNMRLPMILFASIPGQETWNEDVLIKNNAAYKARKLKDIPDLVNRVLLSQDVYDLLKAGIDKLRRPYAAERIVDVVMREIASSGDRER